MTGPDDVVGHVGALIDWLNEGKGDSLDFFINDPNNPQRIIWVSPEEAEVLVLEVSFAVFEVGSR